MNSSSYDHDCLLHTNTNTASSPASWNELDSWNQGTTGLVIPCFTEEKCNWKTQTLKSPQILSLRKSLLDLNIYTYIKEYYMEKVH